MHHRRETTILIIREKTENNIIQKNKTWQRPFEYGKTSLSTNQQLKINESISGNEKYIDIYNYEVFKLGQWRG